jgi:hypothetical protein
VNSPAMQGRNPDCPGNQRHAMASNVRKGAERRAKVAEKRPPAALRRQRPQVRILSGAPVSIYSFNGLATIRNFRIVRLSGLPSWSRPSVRGMFRPHPHRGVNDDE